MTIKRAKELIPHIEAHLLKNCGHLYFSSDKRKQKIKTVIRQFIAE